jgi:hypothetical protein
LAKFKNTTTQSGEIMISLNTVNATLEKKVKTVKDNDKAIIIQEKAKQDGKHAIDTHANHLREETVGMEIKLIKIQKLFYKLDHPEASVDRVQKVKELQASTATPPYYQQLASKIAAEDYARDRDLLSDLRKSIITDLSPQAAFRSHSVNDLLPPKMSLYYNLLFHQTPCIRLSILKKHLLLRVQSRQCRREKAYAQMKRSLCPRVIVVIRLRKLLILHLL